jgi:pyruvate ferredoxin oxidoreductase delta subunit
MKITRGAVVKGGSSLNYKTGLWRDQRPRIVKELCKACGVCVDVCPDNAVHGVEGVYIIDYEFCKGCGLCARECAAKAIEVVAEEK